MKRLLSAAAGLSLAACLSTSAHTQMTTPTAPSGSLKMKGTAIASGTVSFTTVDSAAFGTPVGVMAGGQLFDPQAITCTVAAGAITGSCSVPDLSLAIPSKSNVVLAYNVVIHDNASNASYTMQNVTGVQGSTWALNTYAPLQVAVASLSGLVTGNAVPSSCHGASIFYTQSNPSTKYECIGNVYVQEVQGSGAALNKLIQLAYMPTAYTAYGDSQTFCVVQTYVSTRDNCYVTRIAKMLGIYPPVNRAVVGAQAADVSAQAFSDSPSLSSIQPLRTYYEGINDATQKGAGTYEAVFTLSDLANKAWLTVPLSSKIIGSAAATTGTCSADNTYSGVTGETCTSSGATQTYAITTASTGPIYAWYRIVDGDAGTWTYALDGGTATALTTATTPAISTLNGGTQGAALLRISGVAAGTHNIVFTKTNASGNMAILAVGAPNTTAVANTLPYLMAASIPNEKDGVGQAAVNTYRADQTANDALLAGDGLMIYHTPPRELRCCNHSSGGHDRIGWIACPSCRQRPG